MTNDYGDGIGNGDDNGKTKTRRGVHRDDDDDQAATRRRGVHRGAWHYCGDVLVIMMAKLNKEGDDDDQAPTRRGVHRGERLASSCRHNHENSSIILPLDSF